MIKPIENENLLEDNKRKIEKVLEEKRKGELYGWSCPMNFERCGTQCPYFKMSHPANRCLNREKWIQTKEGMELTDKQLEQLGIKNNAQPDNKIFASSREDEKQGSLDTCESPENKKSGRDNIKIKSIKI